MVTVIITMGVFAVFGMGLTLLSYRLGLSDGQRLSRGERVKVAPVQSAVAAIRSAVNLKDEAEEAKRMSTIAEGLANILSYGGGKQGG